MKAVIIKTRPQGQVWSGHPETSFLESLLLLLCFWNRVSICCPGRSQTHGSSDGLASDSFVAGIIDTCHCAHSVLSFEPSVPLIYCWVTNHPNLMMCNPSNPLFGSRSAAWAAPVDLALLCSMWSQLGQLKAWGDLQTGQWGPLKTHLMSCTLIATGLTSCHHSLTVPSASTTVEQVRRI